MGLASAIYDNTVFNYFVRINTVDLERITRLLFSEKVLIPSQIVVEMERFAFAKPEHKSKVLHWIDLSHQKRFYHYCDNYDSVVLDSLTRILDAGEAAAIAQAERTKVCWFISDDTKNDVFISENYKHIRCHSIFFLLALADSKGLIPDYEKTLAEILVIRKYEGFGKKSRTELRKKVKRDYQAAIIHLGLHRSNNAISKKVNLEYIFNKHKDLF